LKLFEELRTFASLIKPMAEAKGFGIEALAQALEAIAERPARNPARHVLLGGTSTVEA